MSGEILRICIALRRLHHRRARGGRGQGALHGRDVLAPTTWTPCSFCAARSIPGRRFNPGKVFPSPAALRRQAGALPARIPPSCSGAGDGARNPGPPAPQALDDAAGAARARRATARRVLFVGGGDGATRGGPPPVELEISTERLNRVVEYAPADQVVTVEAGVTLARSRRSSRDERPAARARSAPAGARRPWAASSPPTPSGRCARDTGSVRDLIIGVSIVRADGTRAPGRRQGGEDGRRVRSAQADVRLVRDARLHRHRRPSACTRCRRRRSRCARRRRPAGDGAAGARAGQLEPAGHDRPARSGRDGMSSSASRDSAAGVRAQREKLRELEEAEWPGHGKARRGSVSAPCRLRLARGGERAGTAGARS